MQNILINFKKYLLVYMQPYEIRFLTDFDKTRNDAKRYHCLLFRCIYHLHSATNNSFIILDCILSKRKLIK